MADHEASGPATVLFRMSRMSQLNSRAVGGAWSPDSTRVAVAGKADDRDEHDIWVTFIDGRTPIRLTRTAETERDVTWSPDGNMLAYICDDGGTAELKVIPAAGGEAVVLRRWASEETPSWVWSPDSKSLTLAESGMLMQQPLSGGEAEPIVDLDEFGIEQLEWFDWSPDGSQLALAHYTRDTSSNEGVLDSWGQVLFARVQEGRLQQTGATELGPATTTVMYSWSPDSKHVACVYEGLVPVSPGGCLFTVAVDDIIEQIEAGAIPPAGPEPASAGTSPGSRPVPQLEHITDSIFSDDFDDGLSSYWQIVLRSAEASSPPAHAIENGQLMLLNCSAHLGQIDWANYRVTVRLCVTESATSGQTTAMIQTRATPSAFDSNNTERYALLFTCDNNDFPLGLLRLALYYHTASGESRGATVGRTRTSLVPGQWYKLAFEVQGEQLRVYLDDELVIDAMDARLSKGPLWISASGAPVLYDDFSVQRLR
jgi:Tol biopolymer transport system component